MSVGSTLFDVWRLRRSPLWPAYVVAIRPMQHFIQNDESISIVVSRGAWLGCLSCRDELIGPLPKDNLAVETCDHVREVREYRRAAGLDDTP